MNMNQYDQEQNDRQNSKASGMKNLMKTGNYKF